MSQKLEDARRSYRAMASCLVPPLQRPGAPSHLFAIAASGTIIHHPWQDHIWRELNNALSCAYSAVQITRFRYGFDENRKEVKQWLATLSEKERDWRKEFDKQFKPIVKAFNDDLLSDQRHIAEHRKGSAIARVRIECFDMCFVGSPTVYVPPSWMLSSFGDGDNAAVLAAICHPFPVEPKQSDFWFIKPDRPMFPEVDRYLKAAENVVQRGASIAAAVFNGLQPSVFPGLGE
ncbi:MAG TPA: hypothetical protein VNH11_10080 [Pirellulales bacterium]|nr:hypothetical protein [Pirellulales bacterium]